MERHENRIKSKVWKFLVFLPFLYSNELKIWQNQRKECKTHTHIKFCLSVNFIFVNVFESILLYQMVMLAYYVNGGTETSLDFISMWLRYAKKNNWFEDRLTITLEHKLLWHGYRSVLLILFDKNYSIFYSNLGEKYLFWNSVEISSIWSSSSMLSLKRQCRLTWALVHDHSKINETELRCILLSMKIGGKKSGLSTSTCCTECLCTDFDCKLKGNMRKALDRSLTSQVLSAYYIKLETMQHYGRAMIITTIEMTCEFAENKVFSLRYNVNITQKMRWSAMSKTAKISSNWLVNNEFHIHIRAQAVHRAGWIAEKEWNGMEIIRPDEWAN